MTESEVQFFNAAMEISNACADEGKSRSSSDTSTISSVNTCVMACFELPNNSTTITNETLHSSVTDSLKTEKNKFDNSSTSSVSSVDSQIHVTSSNRLIRKETTSTASQPDKVEDDLKSVPPKLSKASFRISTYSSETADMYTERSDNLRTLSTRFSSMQDLSQKTGDEQPVELQEEVENTMRKVQSEVNLMVAQHDSQRSQGDDEQELQDHYKKLQGQFLSWQKRLKDNEILLDAKVKAERASVSQSKAETLPRIHRKPDPRPIRHKPSIKIGTWSDQNNDQHKQYKTEIKIQNEELDEAKETNTLPQAEPEKPKFTISHSKMDMDIFASKGNLPNAHAVRSSITNAEKPATPTRVAEKGNSMKTVSVNPSGMLYGGNKFPVTSTWSKVDQATRQNMPIFKKRGVTTNNRGELVVKGERVDCFITELQDQAIKEAKERMMEQVKNRVKEASQTETIKSIKSGENVCNGLSDNIHSNIIHQSNEHKKHVNKGPLLESNHVGRDGSRCKRKEAGSAPVIAENVYIVNRKNAYDGGKENLIANNISVEQNSVPFPPPPPPPPLPVPNNKINDSRSKSEISVLPNGTTATIVSSPYKKKPRKISEPKLDTREELMLAIRNFGGRCALRNVSSASLL